MIVTREYLKKHTDCIFVFGDNLLRKGRGGAANLRDMPNTYGFITKKAPDNNDTSFYRPKEYIKLFNTELRKLKILISDDHDKTFLISKLGSGLANKYYIWETIIRDGLEQIRGIPNVIFLWKNEGW